MPKESEIDTMLKNLKSNVEIASIGGKVLGICEYWKITTGVFAYRNIYGYQNFERKILAQLNNHLVQPMNREMTRASMYRVMRSHTMKSILEVFQS